MTDLDRYRLLPFDVTAIDVLTTKGWGTAVVAIEDYPKIPPKNLNETLVNRRKRTLRRTHY